MHDELYGQTIACDCGRSHQIEPRRVILREDAPDALPEAAAELTDGRTVAVLADSRTLGVAGDDVCKALERNGWQVRQVLVPDQHGHTPVCDDKTHAEVDAALGETDMIAAVGGGVVCDLGKWSALERNVPYVCFATSASMNGYTSPVIAAAIRGLKTVVDGSPPNVVAADPSILCSAPYELTSAGLGDVVAKPVSLADWRVSHVLFGDYYCPRAASLITEIESLYLDHPEDVRDRKPEAIAALFQALLLTGVGMAMVGSSSPASGAEHLISHTLDMLSLRDDTPHDLHGRQVGIGTILAAAVYERLLSIEAPDICVPDQSIDERFWGSLAGEVSEQSKAKIPRYKTAVESLQEPGMWDRVRQEASAFVLPPRRLRDCLTSAGAAYRATDIGATRTSLTDALLRAHQIRTRFTVFDLARVVGILPGAAAEIVEEWV